MSNYKKSKLSKQSNSKKSKPKQLFTPLNQKEQQALSGGYGRRCGGGGGW